MHPALALLAGASLLALAHVVFRRSRARHDIPRSRAVLLVGFAYALSWACQLSQLRLWEWTGLSLVASPGNEAGALLAMFLFAAPVEEGAKVLSVWPLYTSRRIVRARHGIAFAALAGVGFAAGEVSAQLLFGEGRPLDVLRVFLAAPGHVIAAILWGTALGARGGTGAFAVAWCAATLLRGLLEHIVFGRGPGVLGLAVPLLLTMSAVTYAVARRAASREAAPGLRSSGPAQASSTTPPSLELMWQALEPRKEPLMLPWIAVGTLVTAGVGLVMLGAALYAGRAMGLDFAAADEADVRSNGPLLFLATALGSAFPIAGYLVARASGTRSILEPALGAALAVLGAVLFLSVTTPIAAMFALALAPIAFVLASGGAWFGISR